MKTMTKTCQECGVEFGPTRGWDAAFKARTYCSTQCHGAHVKRVSRANLIEDVEWIVDHDHPDSVAERVGYKDGRSLRDRLYDIGEPELAEKLSRNLERYRNCVEVS